MRAEIVELLSWVAREPRSYPDAIEVWKTACLQHSVCGRTRSTTS